GEAAAYCDIKNMTVRVDVARINSLFQEVSIPNRRLGLEFILAHEISHYVQAFYALRISPRAETPSGFNLLTKPIEYSSQGSSSPTELLKFFLVSSGSQYYSRHAEVDAIALFILRQMGAAPRDIQKAFELGKVSFFSSKSEENFNFEKIEF